MSRKILTIVGARPQFVKAAVMSRLFRESTDFSEVIVHTGQHFDANMSDIFFDQLNMPKPAYNLDINGCSHGRMTGQMLANIDEVIETENPDGVLVYGDTNSTLAGALSAIKKHIPVFHIEAGLRSFNRRMPEEINRVLTDHVSELLFCPTQQSVTNLHNEGIHNGVHFVGDVMYDATLFAKQRASDLHDINDFGVARHNFGLVTIHRAENTDDQAILGSIIEYIKDVASNQNLQILLPLHPRTKQSVIAAGVSLDAFTVCEPLGYFDMQFLLSHAKLVLTDSGGVQKEAYFHRVPCITLRDETEWVETVSAGWNRLWKNTSTHQDVRQDIPDYGDGHAGVKILSVLQKHFKR
jgi:UDP-GlcNAc3NAcA epimerase